MKTLTWLCDDDRNLIDDMPICTLEVDTTPFRNPDGYFEFEGNKYLFYGEQDAINKLIAELSEEERNNVSDGYHTFGELYEHRCVLYVALINLARFTTTQSPFKKSKTHFDGSSRDGRFIAQGYVEGKQISYHLPMEYRDNVRCEEVAIADERDGHTSQDVLDRLLLV